jgi:hypothetical protein
MLRSVLATALVLVVGLCLTGCGGVSAKNVDVTLGSTLVQSGKFAKVTEVDVVAVNDTDLSSWQSLNVPEYFQVGNTFRAGRKPDVWSHVFPGESTTLSVRLPKDSTYWSRWKNKEAKHLVVLASPKSRIVVPLENWKGDTILVNVNQSDIEATNPTTK